MYIYTHIYIYTYIYIYTFFPRGTKELRAAACLRFSELEKQNPTSYLCI